MRPPWGSPRCPTWGGPGPQLVCVQAIACGQPVGALGMLQMGDFSFCDPAGGA